MRAGERAVRLRRARPEHLDGAGDQGHVGRRGERSQLDGEALRRRNVIGIVPCDGVRARAQQRAIHAGIGTELAIVVPDPHPRIPASILRQDWAAVLSVDASSTMQSSKSEPTAQETLSIASGLWGGVFHFEPPSPHSVS